MHVQLLATQSLARASMSDMAEIQSGSTSKPGPNQPKSFRFPSRSFGTKGNKRSFKPAWFVEWPWLDYVEGKDSVLCFYCSEAHRKKLLPADNSRTDLAFILNGFVNWKEACSRFRFVTE